MSLKRNQEIKKEYEPFISKFSIISIGEVDSMYYI